MSNSFWNGFENADIIFAAVSTLWCDGSRLEDIYLEEWLCAGTFFDVLPFLSILSSLLIMVDLIHNIVTFKSISFLACDDGLFFEYI